MTDDRSDQGSNGRQKGHGGVTDCGINWSRNSRGTRESDGKDRTPRGMFRASITLLVLGKEAAAVAAG